jgi:PhoH-like ATPase
LWDNLKYIKGLFTEQDREYKQITEMVENEKLVVCPLAYIRGRSLSNVFFIVDEAQNLTPHEVKTIISRAGENTKIIFTGDIYQIDTPYLDTQSNGLSYLIDRLKNQKLYAHITLEKGERSELANLANEFL